MNSFIFMRKESIDHSTINDNKYARDVSLVLQT
ncbi:hypothetical protein CPARK_000039900 [cyanobacterium endosymbiont of Braarudosphaera bigelowii]|uniref:Uncharacterized protein n=2 Tax=Candidatus Atelocyanobacterium thalassae TaxID=713887 RepID=A0A086CH69_9CHRO|nr:MAG: hypothetical protein ucyna2_00602 [Candidatus Atelocyanobacterium thalassa isolate SIO64986]BDA39560.1 hypothetical protein CPARK_000039900 [cyanobacterium endosymbiont of Braarudosphaera bigelowii]